MQPDHALELFRQSHETKCFMVTILEDLSKSGTLFCGTFRLGYDGRMTAACKKAIREYEDVLRETSLVASGLAEVHTHKKPAGKEDLVGELEKYENGVTIRLELTDKGNALLRTMRDQFEYGLIYNDDFQYDEQTTIDCLFAYMDADLIDEDFVKVRIAYAPDRYDAVAKRLMVEKISRIIPNEYDQNTWYGWIENPLKKP